MNQVSKKHSLTTGKWVLLTILFLTHTGLSARQQVLEIIQLSHRPAQEMVNVIRPILNEDEAAIARGFQLIVKVSPARLEEIRRLIRQLDTSVHRLMITVLQGKDFTVDELNARARVRVRIGDRNSGGSGVSARGHYYQTESEGTLDATQKIQVLEGNPALIKIGKEHPVPYYSAYRYGNQAVVQGGIDYREATTGFSVVPRLAGQQVILQISPWSDQRSALGNGIIETQRAQTTLRAALGEWVEIGGQVETESFDETGTLSKVRRTRKQNNRIFVMVTDLDASNQ